MAYYETALGGWSLPVESLAVGTRFGETHILAAGPPAAPPLLLLHGLGDTALLWKPLFAGLSQQYRLYAPDILGQPGKSAPVRLPYRGSAFGEWLQDVLDALGLVAPDVIGLSLGAFLALRLSMLAPQRAGRLVLLSPAGMAPVKLSTVVRLLPVGLFPSRTTCRRFMECYGVKATDEALDWASLMTKHFIPAPPPPLLPPDQLRNVAAPVSVLAGQHDLFFDAEEIVRRARRYLPHLVSAKVLPGVGHNLVREAANDIQAFLLSALRS